MKRFSTVMVSAMFGSLMLAASAFAGVNYAEYRTQFDAQKTSRSTVADNKNVHACCPMCNGKAQCDMQGCGSK